MDLDLGLEFKRNLWRSMRSHWPAEYQPQVFFECKKRTEAIVIEFTVFFIAEERELRLDWDIAVDTLDEEPDLVDFLVGLMFEQVQKDLEEGVA